MDKSKPQPRTFSALVYLVVVSIIFIAIMFITEIDAEYINNIDRLHHFDFSGGIAVLSPSIFDEHPHALYTPEDFSAGRASQASQYEGNPTYVTYRIIIPTITDGTVYGLTGLSATHAMRLWVDGVLLAEVGTPGNSYQAMTPRTNYFAVYFTAQGAQAEIIIQRSSFVLVHGGRLNQLYFGEQQLITTSNLLDHVRISIAIGVTLMAALVYMGIFIFFKNQMRFLWITLVCLMIAVRTLGIDFRLIATIFPNLDWYTDYLIAYLATSAFVVFFILYINAMMEDSENRNGVNRFLLYGTVAALSAHAIFMLVTPPTIYSRLQIAYNIGIAISTVGVTLNVAWLVCRHKNKRDIVHILVLLGAFINTVLGAGEVIIRNANPQVTVNFTQMGAIIFVFFNTIALALYFRNTEAELYAQQQRNRETIETNKMLARLGALKSSFIADISHEMKSPLGIMSGYAELTKFHIDTDMVSEDTKKNLRVISEEAHRLAQLVERLLDVSAAKEGAAIPISVEADDIISRAVALIAPVLAANRNRLDVQVEENCPPVAANTDMILQVLFNLVGNANRHCADSSIILRISKADSTILFSVADNGTGIPPEILSRVFERGISGDNSSGLGLSICKEAVEAYGGGINIKSERGNGTTVSFTLPIYNEQGDKA